MLSRLLLAFGALSVAVAVSAQPDPRAMAGIPRPVTDLPDRSISVRLVRGQLSNNITGHPVELHVGGRTMSVQTDESGRAQFDGLTAGEEAQAVAVVDGERLESQSFPVPSRGGVRLILVATPGGSQAETETTPAEEGEVVIGRRSQILIEPDEETIRVYYLLDITNYAQVPVNPPKPFMFDTPRGALSTTIMEGSSPRANAKGTSVNVRGPFPPGQTLVQVAYVLPTQRGAATITQVFPARLEHVAAILLKTGDARLSSPLFARQQEMPAGGQMYIAAAGDDAIPPGQPVEFSVSGLPHHSTTPRWIALSLAALIMLVGFWATRRPLEAGPRLAERKRLVARREKLLQELVRLEADRRRGKDETPRQSARREELISALEQVYGALDTDDTSPGGPSDRAGLAA
jgi:hypothetical protein